MRFLSLLVFLLGMAATLQGQSDPHFSQYRNTPLWLNPAKAGQIDGDLRVIANYRNQWNSVTTPFSTVSLSSDLKIPKYFGKTCSYFGAGLYLLNDTAGDADFRTTLAQLALSYHQALSNRGKPIYLSAGLMVGAGQGAFDQSSLYFDNQYNGIGFNTDLPTGENFSKTSLLYLDLSAGINFSTTIGKRSGLSGGVALYHINRPKVSFMDDDNVRLYSRFVLNAEGKVEIKEDLPLTLLPSVVYMTQGSFEELTVGLLARYGVGRLFSIAGGVYYRNSDAVIPTIRFEVGPVGLGFSYDVNISQLKVASGSSGGMEFSLTFIPKIYNDKQQCGAIFCPW